MFFKYYISFLIFTLLTSTLMVLSSSSWLMVWFSLEVNLMSFIPLLISSSSPFSSEASIKYFLTQALASVLILFPGLLMVKSSTLSEFLSPNSLIITALGIKSGMAPTHFWFPPVMEMINWSQGAILLTWQKIAPLALLFSTNSSFMLIAFIIISSMTGPMGGFNLNSLKKNLTFSSISHLAWMASSTLINFKMWLTYFSVYSFISLSLIFSVWAAKMYKINTIASLSSNKVFKSIFFLNFLSLAGMPPFTGIFPKIILMMNLSMNKLPQIFIIIFLISSSVVTLFFYIKVVYSTMMTNNTNYSNFLLNKMNWPITLSSLVSLTIIGNIALFPLVLLI